MAKPLRSRADGCAPNEICLGPEPEPSDLSSPEDRARYDRVAALEKFDDARRAYDAKLEASGWNEANDRWWRLYEAQCSAEDAVLKAKPQTLSGASALLLFTAEKMVCEWDVENFMAAIVNAARAIADGAPVKVSKELQEVLDGGERHL